MWHVCVTVCHQAELLYVRFSPCALREKSHAMALNLLYNRNTVNIKTNEETGNGRKNKTDA